MSLSLTVSYSYLPDHQQKKLTELESEIQGETLFQGQHTNNEEIDEQERKKRINSRRVRKQLVQGESYDEFEKGNVDSKRQDQPQILTPHVFLPNLFKKRIPTGEEIIVTTTSPHEQKVFLPTIPAQQIQRSARHIITTTTNAYKDDYVTERYTARIPAKPQRNYNFGINLLYTFSPFF